VSYPLVNIIMSVYNSEEWINYSVKSILNQTYKNIELIVIDDCSTDNTKTILESYNDSRIKLVLNNKNMGLTNNLNHALFLCKGKYVARMDADDIAYENRIEKQVYFLETHEEIDVLGTQIKVFGKSNSKIKYPSKHLDIVAAMCFYNPIAHPSVIMRFDTRKNLFLYDISIKKAQDYDLWCKLSNKIKFANLKKTLLKYRVHSSQISSNNQSEQNEYSFKIRMKYLTNHGLSTDNVMKLFNIESNNQIDLTILYEYTLILSQLQNFEKKSLIKQITAQKLKLIISSNNSYLSKILLISHTKILFVLPYIISRLFRRLIFPIRKSKE